MSKKVKKQNKKKPWGIDENVFCLFMHLTLVFYLIPIPIIMWLSERKGNEFVNSNGKAIVNHVISFFIFYLICFILIPSIWFLIGFFILAILSILCFILPIIAALNAHQGKKFKYPLSIQFFK